MSGIGVRVGRGFYDTFVLTWRNTLRNLRDPGFLVTEVLVVPVLFTILFAYVFGGAIHVPRVSYIDFLMPGIFVTTVLTSTLNGAGTLAEDLTQGLMDRFRSLSIAYWAVPVSRVIADLVFDALGVLIMVAVGYAIGFRFHGTPGATAGALALVLLFAFAIAWLGTVLASALRTPATVQAAGGMLVFPLMLASSVFVPTQTMPSWLRAVAQHTPVTYTADAIRHLVLGTAGAEAVTMAIVWAVGIAGVSIPLATLFFRRLAH